MAVHNSTYHTKKLNPKENSTTSHYSWLSGCSGEMQPFKKHHIYAYLPELLVVYSYRVMVNSVRVLVLYVWLCLGGRSQIHCYSVRMLFL